jgi:hypothetical protein
LGEDAKEGRRKGSRQTAVFLILRRTVPLG